MSKRPITLLLANDETISVEAYTTATEGLVVHREYRYSPSKKAHRSTSKWTVSHLASGTSILLPGQMLTTKMEAMALAERIQEIDWNSTAATLDTSEVWEQVQTAYKEVSNEQFDGDLDRTRHGIGTLAELDPDYDGVYGMRSEGRGRERIYVIFNKEDDTEKERHALPGVAAERLAELNSKEGG